MTDKLRVLQFWEENYTILEDTTGLKCPSPAEAYSHFTKSTGLTHINLETFKVITGGLRKGIKLSKKRPRKQRRFYNVTSKRQKLQTLEHNDDKDVFVDTNTEELDSIATLPEVSQTTTCDEGAKTSCDEDATTTCDDDGNAKTSCDDNQSNDLLDKYLEHQESMQMNKKTTSALREKHKAPSTRKQMFEILKGKGLYQKFPAKKFEDFKLWLASPSGGQLRCIAEILSEVSRFLYFCNPNKVKWKKLLDTKAFNNYLIATKESGLGPDGLKTKLERISTALKFLGYKKPKLHEKCNKTREEYLEWIKPLVKQKKVLRMKNSWRDELCGFNLNMEDLDSAISDETINKFIKIMKKAMRNEILTQEQYRVVVDTLITLTITQESAIRPGAFQFMTLQELDSPVTYISPTDGTVYNIVFVLNHKTFGTHGPLAVPFPESAWIQLHNYLKYVRPQVNPKPPHQQLVFLNACGKMISKPGQAVSKVTKQHEKHITPTKIRHCVATAGNDVLTDVERRAVAKGIGHTMDVHNKTYTDLTIKTVKSSIEAQKRLHDRSKQNTF